MTNSVGAIFDARCDAVRYGIPNRRAFVAGLADSARVSVRKAIIAAALIWALWHVPFLLSGILSFANVSRGPATVIMPVGEFGTGRVIG